MHHMRNHYNGLTDTKPQLKIEAPKRYVYDTIDKEKKHLLKHNEDLETKVCMRKVAQMKKGYVDHNKPGTYDMKHLKGKYQKGEKHISYEHGLNVGSMKKKIGTKKKDMLVRKKDPMDPVAYPVRFFRKNEEGPKQKVDYLYHSKSGVSRLILTNQEADLKDKLEKKISNKLQGDVSKIQKKDNDKLYDVRAVTNTGTRKVGFIEENPVSGTNSQPQPAKNKRNQISPEDDNLITNAKLELTDDDIKSCQGDGLEDLMKKRLLHIIVTGSLYRDVQLEALFKAFRNINLAKINRGVLDSAIDGVWRAMDE